jgi:S1-C subfamily serine protease
MEPESLPDPTPETRRKYLVLNAIQRGFKRVWLIAVLFGLVFLGAYVYNLLYPAPIPPTQSEIEESVFRAMASATPMPTYSSQVYQMILPSLVYIQTQQEAAGDEHGFGVGTGIVVNENAEILTALHVVEDATVIEVIFADGSQSFAAIVSTAPENDLAVLSPDKPPELIVPAILGSSSRLRVGDEAFAVGNPMGLVASMSAGVISGFDRSIPSEKEGNILEGLIQFDTAVNPGNSGGPLLNRQGQVIGIVTALANPAEQNFFVGIGFAVPIGVAVAAAGGPEY